MAVMRLLTGDAPAGGPVSMAVVPNDMPLRARSRLAGRPCCSMSIGALLSSAILGNPAPPGLRLYAALRCECSPHSGRMSVCRPNVSGVQAFAAAECLV